MRRFPVADHSTRISLQFIHNTHPPIPSHSHRVASESALITYNNACAAQRPYPFFSRLFQHTRVRLACLLARQFSSSTCSLKPHPPTSAELDNLLRSHGQPAATVRAGGIMSQTHETDTAKRGISPASLKRKRDLAEHSNPRISPDVAFKAPKLMNGALNGMSHGNVPFISNQQFEAGDMLQGVGSASSLASTASSVFSSSAKVQLTSRATSTGNGYSPLTNLTESSSPKTSSPHVATNDPSTKPSTSNMYATGVTTSQARCSIFPPAGSAKGYRVVWDPELDGKLSKDERKRATVKRKEFGLEVRYYPRHLLSLRNIIHIT